MMTRDEREDILRKLPNRQRAHYHMIADYMESAHWSWVDGEMSESDHAKWVTITRDLVGSDSDANTMLRGRNQNLRQHLGAVIEAAKHTIAKDARLGGASSLGELEIAVRAAEAYMILSQNGGDPSQNCNTLGKDHDYGAIGTEPDGGRIVLGCSICGAIGFRERKTCDIRIGLGP